jgi:Sec-independent protein translocase protein TatA
MGLGTEILFIVVLGFLFVGPKRLPTILGQIARAKAQLENATRKLESELGSEIDLQRHDEHVAANSKTAGEQ